MFMNLKTRIEAEAMLKLHPSPPPDRWYDEIPLPVSWCLAEGRLRGSRLLDVGCGTGWVAYRARKAGANVMAADIYHTHCKADLPFVLAPCDSLPFPENFFDVVMFSNVLHHGDIFATCHELHRVLKQGGVMISLQEPCINDAQNEEDILAKACAEEIALGFDERRPSLRRYKRALRPFLSVEFFEMRERIFAPPVASELRSIPDNVESIGGGIAIRATK